jgi:predicted SAM-dependent methyltransferase
MKLLNIGCGTTYHRAWVNIDINPVSQEIIRHDAGTPLPFNDSSFDACYCSHVLEHLSCDEALRLLTEIHRVLIPHGIIRWWYPTLKGLFALI